MRSTLHREGRTRTFNQKTRHMKGIYTVCIAALAATSVSQAQITVTNSVFPVVWDTLYYAFGNQPDAITNVFTPPGGDQVWDLSGLQTTDLWQQGFVDPSAGQAFAEFPSASSFFRPHGGDTNREDYVSVTPNAVNFDGSFGADPLGIGMDLTIHWIPSIPLSRAPLNFFDIHQTTSTHISLFLPSAMPPGTVEQLPVVPDSLRIRQNHQQIDVVDAWGTLSIPGGTFPVLREKRTEYMTTSIDVLIPLGGSLVTWVDLATLPDPPSWTEPAGTDTTISFRYINDLTKEVIATCWLNNAQNTVEKVQYKVAELSTSTGPEREVHIAVQVFPNPATDRLLVQTRGMDTGKCMLVITDATGRVVRRVQGTASAEHLSQELELQGLHAGAYQGSIVQQNGRSTSFRFIKQ